MAKILAACVVVFACATPNLVSAAPESSEADRQACTPDVFRLCSQHIPDVDSIVACLKKEKRNLSHGCRMVFDRRPIRPVKASATSN